MRTSGASSETPLVGIPLVVAVIALVLLAGGPTDFLRVLDHFLHDPGDVFRSIAAWVSAAF